MTTKRSTSTTGKKQSGRQPARERVAELRRRQARQERRERLLIFGGTGIAAAALIAGATWAVLDQRGSGDPAAPPAGVSGRGAAPPPWPLPADPARLARNAGLTVQPMEGTAKHFHAHLDVLVNGKAVPVPGNLGIDPAGQAMSELHTHDERGVLHIEAPTKSKRYTLGQLFAEWDVRLDARNLGGLRADGRNALRAFVDGKQATGDPADIELAERREIALVYGPPDAKVKIPSSYDFQPGE